MKIKQTTSLKKISLALTLLSLGLMGVFSSCNSVEHDSTKFKYSLNPEFPRFNYLSVNALGKSSAQTGHPYEVPLDSMLSTRASHMDLMIKLAWHSCGAIKPLIPDFIEIGLVEQK